MIEKRGRRILQEHNNVRSAPFGSNSSSTIISKDRPEFRYTPRTRGWSDFKMINYYTKRLGLDGHISKEKLLLQEDKTRIEMELELQKKELDDLREMFARFQSER